MRDVIYEMSRKGLGHDVRRGRRRPARRHHHRRRPAPQDGRHGRTSSSSPPRDVMTPQPGRPIAPDDAGRRSAAPARTAQDHLDRRRSTRTGASRASCTCTTSGGPRWSERAPSMATYLPLHLGAARRCSPAWPSARRGSATSCATAGGSIGAARAIASLRARPELLVVEPDRSRDRGAEPGGTRRQPTRSRST